MVQDSDDFVIDLLTVFSDAEDDDDSLVYSIVSNTNPGLFTTVTVDGGANTLTLDLDASSYGTATIVVRATDSDSETVDSTFTITVVPDENLLITTLSDAVSVTGVAGGLSSWSDHEVICSGRWR